MSDGRKNRVWPWVVALLIAPILYVASFGPACWLVARGHLSGEVAGAAYWPVLWIYGSSDNRMTHAISSYARFGLRDDDLVSLPFYQPGGGCVHWQFLGRDSNLDARGIKASVEIIRAP